MKESIEEWRNRQQDWGKNREGQAVVGERSLQEEEYLRSEIASNFPWL